jgi:O-antigen ligase
MAATMILCGTALAAVFFVRMPRWRWFTAATVISGSLGVFLNATRSASLTWLILAVWLILTLRKNRMFPIILFAILAGVIIFLSLVPAEHWKRMLELLEPGKDFTLSRRLSYHMIGFDLLERFPIFGAGFGSFPRYFVDFDYRWIPGTMPDEDGIKDLHNLYLQTAAESGIVGLACFLGLLGACLRSISQVRREAASPDLRLIAEAVQFSFVGLLIQIAFGPDHPIYLWLYIGFAIALHYLNKAESRRLAAAGHRLSSSVEG